MHSRIFQLSNDEVTEPLTESSIIAFNEWFVNQIADYVDENTNRESDIDWLLQTFNEETCKYITVFKTNDLYVSITFKPGFKEEYFREKFTRLKELVKNLTLEEFSDSSSITAYSIKDEVESKFGFYVYNNETEFIIPFDTFVRELNGTVEETYYFGNTIDYHW